MTSDEIWNRDGFHTNPKDSTADKVAAAWLKEIAYQLALIREELQRPSASEPAPTSKKPMTPKTLNQLRTEKLSPEKRREIAKKAARARWGKK